MITYDDVLNLNFYKKEKFTGSYQGMRYLIEKKNVPVAELTGDSAADSVSNDTENAPSADAFLVSLWVGPYNSIVTPTEKKTFRAFPFSEEGKRQAVDWLNEQWNARADWRTAE